MILISTYSYHNGMKLTIPTVLIYLGSGKKEYYKAEICTFYIVVNGGLLLSLILDNSLFLYMLHDPIQWGILKDYKEDF